MPSLSRVLAATVAVLSASVAIADLGETCITNGGYDEGVSCVDSCRNFVDDPPFTSSTNPYTEPTQTTNETWCATIANYAPSGSIKKKWGFCLCTPNTKAPTYEPTPFVSETVWLASGGWLTQETQCNLGTIQTTQGGELINVTGCLPMGNYSLYRNEASAKWNGGNGSYWCPTISNLRLHLDSANVNNRDELRSWGFCRTEQTSQAPTAFPTGSPVTPAPSFQPTTGTPSFAPSPQPTAFVPVTSFVASGAWQTSEVECSMGVVETSADGNSTNVTGCLPMEGYNLFINEASGKWNGGNSSYWCPTIPLMRTWLDSADTNNRDELRSWGFCKSVTTSRSPTEAPTAFVPVTTWYATGGGVGISSVSTAPQGTNMEECLLPFTIKGSSKLHTSCLNISEIAPDMTPNGDFPGAPLSQAADMGFWCPIGTFAAGDDNYNGDPTKGKSDRWGYCFGVESTREPVAAPGTSSPTWQPSTMTPTDGTTMAPSAGTPAPSTMSPTTLSPTSSPLPEGVTRAPTISTDAPTQNPVTNAPTSAGFSIKPDIIVAAFFVIISCVL